MAANLDKQHPGERWRIWQECGRHEGLPATSDDPQVAYCERCWSLFKLPPGTLRPGPGVSQGELLRSQRPPSPVDHSPFRSSIISHPYSTCSKKAQSVWSTPPASTTLAPS